MFANSNIAMRLARQNTGLPPDENLGRIPLPYIVNGDEAFPLMKYLMRPIPEALEDPARQKEFLITGFQEAEIQ